MAYLLKNQICNMNIELNESEITAKAEQYADNKLQHFKPFIDSYRQAIINAYIDAYVAGKCSNETKMSKFLDDSNTT